MLASHEGLQRLGIVARQRIEAGATTARGILLGRGHAIQIAFGIRRIIDCGQCIQIAAVGLKRDFAVAKQLGDAIAHRNPFGMALAVAQDLLTYTEFLGIVDDRFDPKNETGLVDHLEPVLFDTVLELRSAGALADQAR